MRFVFGNVEKSNCLVFYSEVKLEHPKECIMDLAT